MHWTHVGGKFDFKSGPKPKQIVSIHEESENGRKINSPCDEADEKSRVRHRQRGYSV